jgi:hypothetical protein
MLRNKQMFVYFTIIFILALIPRVISGVIRIPHLLIEDSYTYLHLARFLRGELVEDDQGFRTPGYPLFLNSVFALSGWQGTSQTLLNRIQKHQNITIPQKHLKFLREKENIKLVQIIQHGLGILSTLCLFWLLLNITKHYTISLIGALISIGWNTTWFWNYELYITTETLSATLLLLIIILIRLIDQQSWKISYCLSCSLIIGMLILVHPQFLLAIFLLLGFWLLKLKQKETVLNLNIILATLLPSMMLVGGWILRNYYRYNVFTLSTVTGFNLCGHFTRFKDFDAFSDIILKHTLKKHIVSCPKCIHESEPRDSIYHIKSELMMYWNLSFPAVSKRLEQQGLVAIIKHPTTFLLSVSDAVINYFKPKPLPKKLKFVEPIWFTIDLIFKLSGLLTILFIPRKFSIFLKIITWFIVGTLLLSVTIAGGITPDPWRYCFPISSLLIFLSFSTIWQIKQELVSKYNKAIKQ